MACIGVDLGTTMTVAYVVTQGDGVHTARCINLQGGSSTPAQLPAVLARTSDAPSLFQPLDDGALLRSTLTVWEDDDGALQHAVGMQRGCMQRPHAFIAHSKRLLAATGATPEECAAMVAAASTSCDGVQVHPVRDVWEGCAAPAAQPLEASAAVENITWYPSSSAPLPTQRELGWVYTWVSQSGRTIAVTPQGVATCVLAHVQRCISASLPGDPVQHCVVTVPAHFGDVARSCTAAAAAHAGWATVHLVSEPTAAAVAYGALLHTSTTSTALDAMDTVQGGLTNAGEASRDPSHAAVPSEAPQAAHGAGEAPPPCTLVVDCGGGTLDASALLLTATGAVRVGGTAGDSTCGGMDVDDTLLRIVRGRVQGSKGSGADAALFTVQDAELWKCRVVSTGAAVQVHSGVAVTVEDVNSAAQGLAHKAVVTAHAAVRGAHEALGKPLGTFPVSTLLLVGGSSRLPALRSELQAEWPGAAVVQDAGTADAAVALGAAFYAAGLGVGAAGSAAGSTAVQQDVTPMPVGITTPAGYVHPLLPANTPLGCVRTAVIPTAVDHQRVMLLQVRQGTSPLASKCAQVGELTVPQLTVALRGQVKVVVRGLCTPDGQLLVDAAEYDEGTHGALDAVLRAGPPITRPDDMLSPEDRAAHIRAHPLAMQWYSASFARPSAAAAVGAALAAAATVPAASIGALQHAASALQRLQHAASQVSQAASLTRTTDVQLHQELSACATAAWEASTGSMALQDPQERLAALQAAHTALEEAAKNAWAVHTACTANRMTDAGAAAPTGSPDAAGAGGDTPSVNATLAYEVRTGALPEHLVAEQRMPRTHAEVMDKEIMKPNGIRWRDPVKQAKEYMSRNMLLPPYLVEELQALGADAMPEPVAKALAAHLAAADQALSESEGTASVQGYAESVQE